MDYSPQKKQVIISIVLGVAGVLGFLALLTITYLKLGEVEQGVAKENEISGNIENVLYIKKQIIDSKQDLETLDSFFVKPGEEAYFIDRIEALAKSKSLKIETSSVTIDAKSNPDFEIMNIVVNYEGGLYAITDFLSALEKVPQAIAVKGVEANSGASGSLWSGNALISVYKLK